MKKGILLVNLGSPASPKKSDIRRYLKEFLMDPRVLDTPPAVRAIVVYAAILPWQPRRSAEAYKRIWTPEGSPLVVNSRKMQTALQQRLGAQTPVELAMRYQEPGIPAALERLRAQGVDDLLVIPLFPHYAMSTYETAAFRVWELAGKIAPEMKVRVLPPFYDDPGYIRALTASAAGALAEDHDLLIFSFHNLPQRHLRKTDPTGRHCLCSADCCERPSPARKKCYRAQCRATARAFAEAAGVLESQYAIAYQSPFGADRWLEPETDIELARLARSGVRKIAVICPSFVADCLETLEEVAMRCRDIFLTAGGTHFTFIPCLNDDPLWIDALEAMARRS